jgi:glycogen/starch/alpha-glucan phosphorylase-like protein
MVKRLHEYKRQLLKLLHVLTVYNRIKTDPAVAVTPCAVIFGAKAAPSYHEAKRIIKLINSVAAVVNADPDVAGRIKVVFLPDYNVSVAELVVAAGNVSEQISLAGKEASGTGNMKLALNGAVTVGTLDGANIEIRDRVGAGNFFLFGVTAEQAVAVRQGGYSPRAYYEGDAELKAAIDAVTSGTFSGGDREAFKPVISSILDWDEYLVLADYRSYIDCQDRAVGPAWADEDRWTRMSILNTARSGFFLLRPDGPRLLPRYLAHRARARTRRHDVVADFPFNRSRHRAQTDLVPVIPRGRSSRPAPTRCPQRVPGTSQPRLMFVHASSPRRELPSTGTFVPTGPPRISLCSTMII